MKRSSDKYHKGLKKENLRDIILSLAVSVLFVSTIFLSGLILIKSDRIAYVYIIFMALLYGMGMISRNAKSWLLKWGLSIPFSYMVLQYFWQTDFMTRAINWVLPGYGKNSAGGNFAGFLMLCFQAVLCFIGGIAGLQVGKKLVDHNKYESFEKKQVIIGIVIALLIAVIDMMLERRFPESALIYS